MGNVLRVFWRDVKRIAKVPPAWLVVLFLVGASFAVHVVQRHGFWNPYENTGNLRVCVVNEDAGASDEMLGDIDLGEQVIDELKTNDQLGWQFMGRDEAMQEVESGEAYAAFVIPEDFSADVTTLLSGDFQQPQLEYYVNEKAGPVAPKINRHRRHDARHHDQRHVRFHGKLGRRSAIDEALGKAQIDLETARRRGLAPRARRKATSRMRATSLSKFGHGGRRGRREGRCRQRRALRGEGADRAVVERSWPGVRACRRRQHGHRDVFAGDGQACSTADRRLLSQAASKTNAAIGQTAGTASWRRRATSTPP